MKKRAAGWWLLWCGSPVKGSPFKTEAEARVAFERLMDSAKAAKLPVYGHYSIEEHK